MLGFGPIANISIAAGILPVSAAISASQSVDNSAASQNLNTTVIVAAAQTNNLINSILALSVNGLINANQNNNLSNVLATVLANIFASAIENGLTFTAHASLSLNGVMTISQNPDLSSAVANISMICSIASNQQVDIAAALTSLETDANVSAILSSLLFNAVITDQQTIVHVKGYAQSNTYSKFSVISAINIKNSAISGTFSKYDATSEVT